MNNNKGEYPLTMGHENNRFVVDTIPWTSMSSMTWQRECERIQGVSTVNDPTHIDKNDPKEKKLLIASSSISTRARAAYFQTSQQDMLIVEMPFIKIVKVPFINSTKSMVTIPEQQIRERAFQIWQTTGNSDDVANWFQAKRELALALS